MANQVVTSNMDQLGTGESAGAYIMGPNQAGPIGADKAVDGILGVEAVTGRLYWASAASGDTGVQGQTGIRGHTGIQGQTGIIGNTGIQGETGIRGLNSTSDPWVISATLGSISGWDSTGGIYLIDSAGHTGICPYYYNA